jgi:isopenicillin-N N-acyltransferase like protein
MSRLRVLEGSGTFYEMGYAHGKAAYDAIHQFTESRISLSSSEYWTGRTLSRESVLTLAEACLAEHQAYSPELMQELQGMADATGLSLPALIINNGFTDFIDVVYNVGDISSQPAQPRLSEDNCTAFLVPNNAAADGRAMFGQTWDMHYAATPHVILFRGKPQSAPAFLTFTIAGCVGMIGMNEAGITVGINNLMATDGQIGVTWPFIIRKILMQNTIKDALSCLTEAKLAGAHNYLIMDRNGNGYNVEAMSTRCAIEELNSSSLVHTNHCTVDYNRAVERERLPASIASSHNRLHRANQLLSRNAITPDDLMALTRDQESICVRAVAPMYTETCGAAIMRPASREMWAVWGLPVENEYEHFTI